MKKSYDAELMVDLGAIKDNVRAIQRFVGNDVKLMAVVKAAGYGTYLNYCAEIMSCFDYVAVATVNEAIELRENNYKGEIFVLNPPINFEAYVNYDLILNGCSIEMLKEIDQKIVSKLKTHIEIDTGMGRTGIRLAEIDFFTSEFKKLKYIEVDGLFSHFSAGGSDDLFSNEQLNDFSVAIKKFADANIKPKFLHICNSGGLLSLGRSFFNMARIGLLLYGYYPNDKLKSRLKLKPALQLKTRISFFKTILAGDFVGYNRCFVAKEKMRIAFIPIGFADCILALEPNGFVVINQKKVPILATCMDSMMIDVSSINDVNVGDEVYFWDNQLLCLDQIENYCSYEIMVSISKRVERRFINE